jgi:hypothetical protein
MYLDLPATFCNALFFILILLPEAGRFYESSGNYLKFVRRNLKIKREKISFQCLRQVYIQNGWFGGIKGGA